MEKIKTDIFRVTDKGKLVCDDDWDWNKIENIPKTITTGDLSDETLGDLFFERYPNRLQYLEGWKIISCSTYNLDYQCNFGIKSKKEAWLLEFKIYVRTVDGILMIFSDTDSNFIDKDEICDAVNKLIKTC